MFSCTGWMEANLQQLQQPLLTHCFFYSLKHNDTEIKDTDKTKMLGPQWRRAFIFSWGSVLQFPKQMLTSAKIGKRNAIAFWVSLYFSQRYLFCYKRGTWHLNQSVRLRQMTRGRLSTTCWVSATDAEMPPIQRLLVSGPTSSCSQFTLLKRFCVLFDFFLLSFVGRSLMAQKRQNI